MRQVLLELRDAVISFNRQGRAVKLEGLGTYTPAIGLDGVISVGHRADTAVKSAVNQAGAFRGEILNREVIPSTGSGQAARVGTTWWCAGTASILRTRWVSQVCY